MMEIMHVIQERMVLQVIKGLQVKVSLLVQYSGVLLE